VFLHPPGMCAECDEARTTLSAMQGVAQLGQAGRTLTRGPGK
jgi:hypothetical protein